MMNLSESVTISYFSNSNTLAPGVRYQPVPRFILNVQGLEFESI